MGNEPAPPRPLKGLLLARAALSQALGVPADMIQEDGRMGEIPGWDSVGHLSVVVALEDLSGLRLSLFELRALTSVRAIIDLLRSKGLA